MTEPSCNQAARGTQQEKSEEAAHLARYTGSTTLFILCVFVKLVTTSNILEKLRS